MPDNVPSPAQALYGGTPQPTTPPARKPEPSGPSIAERVYGPAGPISGGLSDPRVRAQIEGGQAKSAGSIFGGDPKPAGDGKPAEAAKPPASFVAFAAEKYRPAEGAEIASPELMGEFSAAAKELGLDQKGGERLLEMHQKASRAAMERYYDRLAEGAEELQRSLPADGIAAAKELISDAQMTPPELREWLAAAGNHPAFAKMLVTWASAIQRARSREVLTMARFRVLSPLTVERGPQRILTMLERNAILDSRECPAHWVPPPHVLEPLDAEAVEMLRAGFDLARRNAGTEASVPTMGSLDHRLGGSLAYDPAKGKGSVRAPAAGADIDGGMTMPLTQTEQIAELNSRVGRLEAARKRMEATLTPDAPKPPDATKPPAWAAPQGGQPTGSHANPNDTYVETARAASAPTPRKAGPFRDPSGILRSEDGQVIPAKTAEAPRGPELNRQPGFVDATIEAMTPLTTGGR